MLRLSLGTMIQYRKQAREHVPESHRRIELCHKLIMTFCDGGNLNTEDADLIARLVDVVQDTAYGLKISHEFLEADQNKCRDVYELIEKVLSHPTQLTVASQEILKDRWEALERRLI